jgi:polyribonucleotide nucleotidyltransferase
LVVAGTKDAVLMVESEANWFNQRKKMLNAGKFGHARVLFSDRK